jgi:hypothetical protein
MQLTANNSITSGRSLTAAPCALRPRSARSLPITFRLILAWCITALHSSLLAASFHASLDANLIFANEQTTLTLTIENAQPAVAPRPTPVPGLQFRAAGQTEGVRIINGQRSTSLTYPYLIQASQPGDYVIPSIRIRIGGQELVTEPLRLKVLPAEVINPQERNAFLRLVVPRTDLFVGEILPIQIRLYARHGSLRDIPQLQQEGLTLGHVNQQPVRKTFLDGIEYSLVAFETYVSPARAGQLALGPAQIPMNLPVEGGRSDLFGRPLQSRPVLLRSQSVALTVAPLPTEGRPPDFSGAVGDYSLTVRVSTNVVTLGDPITLTVEIAGHGPIEPLQLPNLDHWTDFRVYPPVTQVATTDTFGIQGVKTFDQVVIPKSHDTDLIPPLTFSFFHPESRSYRTLSHPATPITVQPARGQAARSPGVPATLSPDDPASLEPSLTHIKPRLGLQAIAQPPLLTQPWFLAAQSLPLAAFLTALFWRRQQDRLAANPRLRQRQHVARLTRHGIDQLRQHAASNDAALFFALLFRLLQEQLGEKLGRPAAAITEAALDEPLDTLGLDPDSIQLLREIFHFCNQSRFTPQTSPTEPNQILTRAISLLQRLDATPVSGPT